MPTSTRLRGNVGFWLSFKKGAAAAVILSDDVKKWGLVPEDKDDSDLTFYEALSGLGTDWTLNLTAVTSLAAGSLWRFLWDNPGSDIVVLLSPNGNAVASATQPHLSFSINTGKKPPIENEARTTTVGAEFEAELKGITDVVLVTA